MKEFLKRLKLVDYLTTELGISKSDFVKKFKEHVDDDDTGMFFTAFEVFSSSKNEYRGRVSYEGFKIRKRRKLFEINMNSATAEGKFNQRDEVLIIETEINGFRNIYILFYALGIFIYPVFFLSFLFSDNPEMNSAMLLAFPFLLLHATFWFGIPYLVMKRSTKKMKYELEREFFYMTKK
jgi:hypothetical protein